MATNTLTSARPEENQEQEPILTTPEANQLIERYHRLIDVSVFSTATKDAYRENFEELKQNERWQWLIDYEGYILQVRNNAEAYEEEYGKKLEKAKNWIGKSGEDYYWEKFNDPHWLECRRKEWLMTEFPQSLEQRKSVAERKQEIERAAHEKKLAKKDVLSLKRIENEEDFHKKDIRTKEEIVKEAAEEVMTSAVKREMDLAFARYMMEGCAVGPERCFDQKDIAHLHTLLSDASNPHAFLQDIFTPLARKRSKERAAFNALTQDAPKEMTILSLEAWLKLDPAKREIYVKERRKEKLVLTQRAAQEQHQYEKLLHRMEQHLTEKDVVSAHKLLCTLKHHPLSSAVAIQSFDERLKEMEQEENELVAEQQEVSAEHAEEELQTIVKTIPQQIRPLYVHALEKGSSAFAKLDDQLTRQLTEEEINEDVKEEKEEIQDSIEEAGESTQEEPMKPEPPSTEAVLTPAVVEPSVQPALSGEPIADVREKEEAAEAEEPSAIIEVESSPPEAPTMRHADEPQEHVDEPSAYMNEPPVQEEAKENLTPDEQRIMVDTMVAKEEPETIVLPTPEPVVRSIQEKIHPRIRSYLETLDAQNEQFTAQKQAI